MVNFTTFNTTILTRSKSAQSASSTTESINYSAATRIPKNSQSDDAYYVANNIKPPLRLRFAFRYQHLIRYFNYLDAIVNLLFCASYILLLGEEFGDDSTSVYEKCDKGLPTGINTFERPLAITIVTMNILVLFLYIRPMSTFFSWFYLLTLIGTVPVIVDPHMTPVCLEIPWSTFYVVRFWRFHLSCLRCLIPGQTYSISLTAQKATRILLSIFNTLLTITCLVHLVETRQQIRRDKENNPPGGTGKSMPSFFATFYWIIMSSTTGLATNIIEDSVTSRAVILYVMVVGAIFLPSRLAELLDLASKKSIFDKSYKPRADQSGKSHVVVMGDMNSNLVRSFLREFFCLDHGTETMTTVVVLLNPYEPSSDLLAILNDPMYVRRVQYVKGQEISFRSLSKACYRACSGCFILSSKVNDMSRDPQIIDAESIMRVMTLRKYAPTVPIYVSVVLPSNKIHYQFLAEHAICMEELRWGILAQNCHAPGFSTLLIHLLISITDTSINQFLERTNEAWLKEYAHSVSQEIYPISLKSLRGFEFREAVLDIYRNYQALLFALCDSNGDVRLNPELILTGDEVGYVITKDSEIASYIALQENADSTSQFSDSQRVDRNISGPSPPVAVNFSGPDIDEPEDEDSDIGFTGSSGNDELVYKGRKGKGPVHEPTLLKMSPPLPRSSLRVDTPKASASRTDSLDQWKQHNLDEGTTPQFFSNHLVICYLGDKMFPTTMLHFVEPFRKQNSKTPIVILSKTPPKDADREKLTKFPKVYFISGTAYERGDLIRCGIAEAAFAIVTGNTRQELGRPVDSSTMVVVLNIEALSLNPSILIFMDLVHIENMKFIGKSPEVHDLALFAQLVAPSFASGHVFAQSMLNSVLANTYYNPHLLKILNLLVFPIYNCVCHVRIGDEYDGMTWSTVFEVYLKSRGVPLGIYKKRPEYQGGGYYVIVNPGVWNRVSKDDFIICVIPRRNLI